MFSVGGILCNEGPGAVAHKYVLHEICCTCSLTGKYQWSHCMRSSAFLRCFSPRRRRPLIAPLVKMDPCTIFFCCCSTTILLRGSVPWIGKDSAVFMLRTSPYRGKKRCAVPGIRCYEYLVRSHNLCSISAQHHATLGNHATTVPPQLLGTH